MKIQNLTETINFDLHSGIADLTNHTLSATFAWEVQTLSEGNYGLVFKQDMLQVAVEVQICNYKQTFFKTQCLQKL